MSSYLLVHGAFRGGWAWGSVAQRLRRAGHHVLAPSLVGCGELAPHVAAVTGLEVWVSQVAELIVAEDLADVVLVGHSQGGLVTGAVAERVPGRVRAVVHLDAAVPRPGQSAVELTGAASIPPRWAVLPAGRIDRTSGEFSAEVAERIEARLTPSPVAPALDPVAAVPAGIAEHFVFCSRTPAGYPAHATRARVDADQQRYRVIDAFHDAPLSAPDLVAQTLLDLTDHPGPCPTAPHLEASR